MANLPQFADFQTTNVKILDVLRTSLNISEVDETTINNNKFAVITYTMPDSDSRYTSFISDRDIRSFLKALDNGDHLPVELVFSQDKRQNDRLVVDYTPTE